MARRHILQSNLHICALLAGVCFISSNSSPFCLPGQGLPLCFMWVFFSRRIFFVENVLFIEHFLLTNTTRLVFVHVCSLFLSPLFCCFFLLLCCCVRLKCVWQPLRQHLRVELGSQATMSLILIVINGWNAIPFAAADSSNISFRFVANVIKFIIFQCVFFHTNFELKYFCQMSCDNFEHATLFLIFFVFMGK